MKKWHIVITDPAEADIDGIYVHIAEALLVNQAIRAPTKNELSYFLDCFATLAKTDSPSLARSYAVDEAIQMNMGIPDQVRDDLLDCRGRRHKRPLKNPCFCVITIYEAPICKGFRTTIL